MASIRKIDNIVPIVGADAIECAMIGGWSVVVKRGEFNVGDLAVYCEIDSWIPHDIAPFLSKGQEPREYNGVKGEKLKTIRLRGQLSQGLLLPRFLILDKIGEIFEGMDVSEILGIQKWEPPVSPQLAGQTKGTFPSFIPKTDQERVQNLVPVISSAFNRGDTFEITEKMEGSSMTVYMHQGEFGVCSRNQELKQTEDNTFWKVALENDIENRMRSLGLDNIAIQGELIGPGIQGNIYKLTNHKFVVFDIYDIKKGEYLNPTVRFDLVCTLLLLHVPVINVNVRLPSDVVSVLLKFAEDKSVVNVNQEREGIVFKNMNGGFSFKAISNRYLLKQG
jgi:RNA ligase (TIGR02306 family)